MSERYIQLELPSTQPEIRSLYDVKFEDIRMPTPEAIATMDQDIGRRYAELMEGIKDQIRPTSGH